MTPQLSLVLPLFVLVGLLGTPAVQAWWEVPHYLTAEIARQTLEKSNPLALSRATKLVEAAGPIFERSASFSSAAIWADDIKAYRPEGDRWNPLHYIDIPYLVNVTTGPPIPPANLATALHAMHEILAAPTDAMTASNIKATPGQKVLAVRFFLHFCGDIHQPLHCASRVTPELPDGDAGGNLFKLNDTGHKNLHSFWDDAGGYFQGVTRTDTTTLRDLAAGLIKKFPSSSFETFSPSGCNFTEWAYESYERARTIVYVGVKEYASVTAEYRNKTQHVTTALVALGGYRLAACLAQSLAVGGDVFGAVDNSSSGVSKLTFASVVGIVAVVGLASVVVAIGLYCRARHTNTQTPRPTTGRSDDAAWDATPLNTQSGKQGQEIAVPSYHAV